MKEMKIVIYRYNSDPLSEERETDLYGEVFVPQYGEIVHRKGESWKVVKVDRDHTVGDDKRIPVLRIHLTRPSNRTSEFSRT